MRSLKDKIIVITGAGSGIGRALALQAADEGAKLALNDWNGDALGETVHLIQEKGGDVMAIPFDVSKREAMEAFAEEVVARYGRVDVMVNNAGIALPLLTVEETSYEDIEKIFGVNLWGMIYGSKVFLPHLRERPEAALVNVSSIFGMVAYPSQGAYNTAKFGIKGFTETLRNELRETNITISSVHPGGIRTNIVRNVEYPDKEEHDKFIDYFDTTLARTSPERAAEVIFNGIKAKRNRIMIGPDAWLMDRAVRWFPQRYDTVLKWVLGFLART